MLSCSLSGYFCMLYHLHLKFLSISAAFLDQWRLIVDIFSHARLQFYNLHKKRLNTDNGKITIFISSRVSEFVLVPHPVPLQERLLRSVCQLLLISVGEVASVLSSDKAMTLRLKNVNPGAVTIEAFPLDRQCRTPQHNALMISHTLFLCFSAHTFFLRQQSCPQWSGMKKKILEASSSTLSAISSSNHCKRVSLLSSYR